MTFSAILYTLLIKPLELFFETIFITAEHIIRDPGLSIIVLSIVMNFLVLPLYKKADAMQAEERDTEARLHGGVAHIRKVFSGDERMMILQTYYRQNHYQPANIFRGSVSLFLEIPFFIAAYRFLSALPNLQGAALGPIRDLGAPDGLLTVFGVTLNLLPILMTAANLISCVIYTKGFPAKTKIQLYGMAVFFLFFLYSSPAGLVFYWTLNNVFSLLKNIFYKLRDPGKVLAFAAAAAGTALALGAVSFFPRRPEAGVFIIALGLALWAPLALRAYRAHHPAPAVPAKPDPRLFFAAALFLAAVLGLLIPSALIQSSPQEFVDIANYHNPLWYVASSFCLAVGTFVIWFGVFYRLADDRGKTLFEKLIWVFCGIAIIDYLFFGSGTGILSASLTYEKGLGWPVGRIMANIIAVALVAFLAAAIMRKYRKLTIWALVAGIIAATGMSAVNAYSISGSVAQVRAQAAQAASAAPHFTLSRTGKNVVVIMLDRGMGTYIPYLFNEKPELADEFSGFVYYANTMSFGGSTNFGSPALYGGYEYTPVAINKRTDKKLAEKQNEALRVMPVLFEKSGYDVTVCDPSYAGYRWTPDLSIYSDYPDIHAYITNGRFNEDSSSEAFYRNSLRNFFCYSLMKTAPLIFQPYLYSHGSYNQANQGNTYSSQSVRGTSVASGLDKTFMNAYNVLKSLPKMTEITDKPQGGFLMMANDTTHSQALLQEPEYEPRMQVDNTAYDQAHQGRFTLGGRTLKVDNAERYQHYEINMAALIQLGKWFDYLKANDLYDNTRIILVSDHGRTLGQFKELIMKDGTDYFDMEGYAPLLMVKDFDAAGFAASPDFMTNGDVPTLAFAGLIADPVNPATGQPISDAAKRDPVQYVMARGEWDPSKTPGTQFQPGDWLSVHDDIWELDNWKIVGKNTLFPQDE